MIKRQPWFEREFPTGLAGHLLPVVVERLRGTPARLGERLTGISRELLIRRIGDTWSIQENAGHLLDLEPLWQQRYEDLLNRRPELTMADLTNRQTQEANHNAMSLDALLRQFRQARAKSVQQLESFPDDQLQLSAQHPRLKKPMNIVDIAYFVAEHDDYHLARISELLRELKAA
jgi:uncharacterized damage-inducible protein DinB